MLVCIMLDVGCIDVLSKELKAEQLSSSSLHHQPACISTTGSY